MTQAFTTLVVYENSYGGYTYVEYSIENRVYAVGDSNRMSGSHAHNNIRITVQRKKDIKELLERLERYNFKRIPSF